jgi:hypothetical protein
VKRYLVLIGYVESDWDAATPQEREAHHTRHAAFEEYVATHGRRLGAAPLAGVDTATTVRHVDGKVTVTDGPFVEGVEVIGGYYDVELPDLDHAIEAAALLPASYAVEIRPTVAMGEPVAR